MAEAEANWYVVHTYSGYENKVMDDITNTIKNRGLQDQILEVMVPVQDVTEIKNGKRKPAKRKLQRMCPIRRPSSTRNWLS